MDERRTEGGGPAGSGFDRDRDRTSAGSANTPMFDRETSGTGQGAHAHGRPPSHRELQEGTLGESGERTGDRMEGIAMPETKRTLEQSRDTLAREAAPVIAEKMQEAIAETTDRLSDTIGEQAKRTAEAVRHDAERIVGDRVNQIRGRLEEGVDQGLDRAAEGIGGAARTLHQTADRHLSGGGVRGTAGRLAHGVADAGENAASYLRETDAEDLTRSLEYQVRENPLQTLALAVAAGWLVGKILR
jgi:ElaB/YqjD/DUF883 family membrane-anchored ribosome-binding protein